MSCEWSDYFEFVCSMYSNEIAELLKDSDYKAIGDEMRKHKDNISLYCELAEKKAACYYEKAAIVMLKHFIHMAKDTESHS